MFWPVSWVIQTFLRWFRQMLEPSSFWLDQTGSVGVQPALPDLIDTRRRADHRKKFSLAAAGAHGAVMGASPGLKSIRIGYEGAAILYW